MGLHVHNKPHMGLLLSGIFIMSICNLVVTLYIASYRNAAWKNILNITK